MKKPTLQLPDFSVKKTRMGKLCLLKLRDRVSACTTVLLFRRALDLTNCRTWLSLASSSKNETPSEDLRMTLERAPEKNLRRNQKKTKSIRRNGLTPYHTLSDARLVGNSQQTKVVRAMDKVAASKAAIDQAVEGGTATSGMPGCERAPVVSRQSATRDSATGSTCDVHHVDNIADKNQPVISEENTQKREGRQSASRQPLITEDNQGKSDCRSQNKSPPRSTQQDSIPKKQRCPKLPVINVGLISLFDGISSVLPSFIAKLQAHPRVFYRC